MNQHQGHLMSLGDQKLTLFQLLTLASWHSDPHPLAVLYSDIRNLLNPGSLPQDFLILLCAWVETYRNCDSRNSFCLLTVPPSLSYSPLHTAAFQPPCRIHSFLSRRTKWHLSQFFLPVFPESSHFFLTPPTHIQATHLFPGWLQLVSCLCSFPHPFKESFLKGRSDHVTPLYKKLQWLVVTVWIKTKTLHS